MSIPEVIAPVGQRYQLLERLGVGAMGVVYRAYDRLSGQTVALKRVAIANHQASHPTLAPQPLLLALAREFKLLASLRHPHIISVLDYGFDSAGQPFFTMELLTRPQTILEAGRGLPQDEQIALLEQALQALAYLHRRGILHHDLKPENILVVGGQVRVLDFGLARASDEARAHDSFGTPRYLAPEVLLGEPYTAAADLYAIGAIAYELLLGRHPFDVGNFSTFLDQVLEAPPDLSPLEDTPDLAAVLLALLAKRPEQRFEDAATAIAWLAVATHRPPPTERGAIRESFLQAASFVGRAPELTQLTQALDRAMAGAGSAWLIGGESGVGKSRLIEELRAHALVSGALVVRGQAVESGDLPYQLWRGLVRPLLLGVDLSELDASVLKEIVPDIAMLLGRAVPDPPALEGVARRQRLARAIAELLLPQEQPVLLLLEDLQWAGESLDPLDEILRLIAKQPLLLVGSYRDDERPDLPARLPEAQLLKLNRLAPEAIAELSAAMLGEAGQQPQIVALLARETEGNAFFMVEVARALAEEAGGLAQIGRLALPGSVVAGGVQQLVRRRLGRVPASARTFLKLAAVAGRQLDMRLLGLLVDTPADLAEWLDSCADVAVLELAEAHWRFAHDKLREGVLAGLTDAERTELHRRVAEAIEAVYAGERERALHAEALREHWRQAGNAAKEVEYILIVAEHAVRLIAEYDQARTLLRRGLALLDRQPQPDGDHQRMQLLHLLGLADMIQAKHTAALQHFETSLALARVLEAPEGIAAALDGLAETNWQLGRNSIAIAYAQEELALARDIGDKRSAARALNLLGIAEWDDYQIAQDYYRQGLALYQELGDQQGMAVVQNNLGDIAMNRGDYAAARALFERCVELHQQIGDRRYIGTPLHNLGQIALDQGDYAAAQEIFERSLEITRAIGDQRTSAASLTRCGELASKRGDYQLAQVYFQQSLALSQASDDQYGISEVLYELGGLFTLRGEFAAADDHLTRSLALIQRLDRQQLTSACLYRRGMLALQQGNYFVAAEHLNHSLAISRQLEFPVQTAITLGALGQLAAKDGTNDAAIRSIEASGAICRRLGLRAELAHGFCVLAAVHARAGQLAAARANLSEAGRLAQAIDVAPLRLEVALAAAQLACADQPIRAAELAGLVAAHPCAHAGVRTEAEDLHMALSSVLPAAVRTSAFDRGASQDLNQMIAAIVAAITTAAG